jgi:hypothetical protein
MVEQKNLLLRFWDEQHRGLYDPVKRDERTSAGPFESRNL